MGGYIMGGRVGEWAGAVANRKTPNEKWGRHCCRPHYRLYCFRPNDWSPYPCLNYVPGRCDAHRATASAMGTGGASHRDARRIGPDRFGREPSRNHCSCQSVRSAPALRLLQIGFLRPVQLHRRLVPSGGRIVSEELFLPPGGSKGVSLLHHQITCPCGLPFRWLPSGAFVPLVSDLAAKSQLSFRTFRPTWSLPIAARLSRHLRFASAHSEELATRVFRRCCGHRCHPDQVKLSHSLSGC